MCDIYGNKTKEWSWKTYHREKIAIQVGSTNSSPLDVVVAIVSLIN